MQPFIYINGFPGVGKLTVARELSKMIPGSRIMHNHLLIDPVAAICERGSKEYQPLRQCLRRTALSMIEPTESTRQGTWIFRDMQSSTENGTSAAKDYEVTAQNCGVPFISVILQCEAEENLRRAVGEGRGLEAHNTKLTDLKILRDIRAKEDVYRFNNKYEIVLDVTKLPAITAAGEIYNHVCKIQMAPFMESLVHELRSFLRIPTDETEDEETIANGQMVGISSYERSLN